MLLGTPKYGIGSFSNREEVESAIKALENSEFSMKQITVI